MRIPDIDNDPVLQRIKQKFESGNVVPVERAQITREEWEYIWRILRFYKAMDDWAEGAANSMKEEVDKDVLDRVRLSAQMKE